MHYLCTAITQGSECSAVGSALRSGRRGRAFESPHSDKIGSQKLPIFVGIGYLLFFAGFTEADYEGCYSGDDYYGFGEHENGFGAEGKGDHC